MLFQSSKPALKSKLLRLLLSNLALDNKKLVFNLKAPFDVIAECSKTQNWLGVCFWNITVAIESDLDVKLLRLLLEGRDEDAECLEKLTLMIVLLFFRTSPPSQINPYLRLRVVRLHHSRPP